ncbi:MAG: mechanosensitive ion channel family protein [Ruminococcaceae bacterium]|nr:mechanosensitive ion channel family protein [Oscillospiraceae bacterium]
MDILSRLLNNIENFVLDFLTVDIWRILLCLLIIVIGLLIKGFISKCVFRLIEKKTAKDDGTGSVASDVIAIIDRPIRLAVMTLAIKLGATVLHLSGGFATIVANTVSTLLLFAVFWMLYNAAGHLKTVLGRLASKTETHMDDIAISYITYAAKAVVIVFGVITILQNWVGDISSLIAGLSIGSLAFALAAQDIAANIFGSITVMLDHPFEIGEYIEVDGVAGTVEKMGLRSTRIRTLDQALIIIPNKTLSSANITNWTKIDRRRVVFEIGVTYSTTRAQLEELIRRITEMLENRDDIRRDGIMVGFADFGDSALTVSIRFYTLTGSPADEAIMRGKVNFAVMDIVEEMGLSFAFPSHSVYIESAPKSE